MKQLVPLYGRVPLGVGTPLTESLTSFIGRLAISRHLTSSSVFNHLIGPLVPGYRVREDSGFPKLPGSSGAVCDGLGKPAEDAVGALTILTGLENLSLHTLLPWRPFISSMYSLALRYKQKRWCASCLAEWRAGGLEFWEPLLWRVKMVSRCPVHCTPFSEACPRCESSQGLLQEVVPFGICRRCGRYLEVGDQWARNGSEALPESEEARREWWLSVEVGRMLAFQSTVFAFANPEGFPLTLKRSASLSGSGSIRGLVRFLGVSPYSVKHWLRGKHLPSLESFLLVCMRLDVDPLHVAILPRREPRGECAYPKGEARPRWPRINRGVHRSCNGPRNPEFWDEVTEALSGMLSEPEAGRHSATRVASMLGIANHTLKARYPVEQARILKLHAAYRKRERVQMFAQRRGNIRAAVDEYVLEGVYPSQERVFLRAGLPKSLPLIPAYKQVWLDALYEYGLAPRRSR